MLRLEAIDAAAKHHPAGLGKPVDGDALLLQYMALLRTENIDVVFEDDAVSELSRMAEEVNDKTENIGARRLHTLMECLLEDILFDAPDMTEKRIIIDKIYVEDKLKDIKDDEDLSRYIL